MYQIAGVEKGFGFTIEEMQRSNRQFITAVRFFGVSALLVAVLSAAFLLTYTHAQAQANNVTISVTAKRYPFPFRGSGTNWEGLVQDRFGGANASAANALFGGSGLKLRTVRLWLHHNNFKGKTAYQYYYGSGTMGALLSAGATEIWGTGIPGNAGEGALNIDAETTRWADVVKDIRDKGGKFNGLDFCNKPNTNFSGCFRHSPEQVAQGIAMLRQKLNQRGLQDVKITGPSTIEWFPRPAPQHAEKYDYQQGDTIRYLTAIQNNAAALAAVDAFSIQNYGMGVTDEMYGFAERAGKEFFTLLNATDPPSGTPSASIVSGQFLSDVNHGVTMWVYWLAHSGGSSYYPALAQLKNLNQAFDVGAHFYKMQSDKDADMHWNYSGTGTAHNNVIAAAAVNPDKSWAVGMVNLSGIKSQHYASSFSGGSTKSVTVHIPELESKGTVNFSRVGSSGTVAMQNGRMTISIAPNTTVVLRSPAGISGGTTGTSGTTGSQTTGTTNTTTGGTTNTTTGSTTGGSTSCSLIQPGNNVATGFAAPWDVVSGTNQLLINVLCSTSGATLSVGVGTATHYIYNQSYFWNGSSWQPFTLTGSQLLGNAWIPGTASASIPTTATGQQFVVAYLCQWVNGAWKCGCRDLACATPQWQLQAFTR